MLKRTPRVRRGCVCLRRKAVFSVQCWHIAAGERSALATDLRGADADSDIVHQQDGCTRCASRRSMIDALVNDGDISC